MDKLYDFNAVPRQPGRQNHKVVRIDGDYESYMLLRICPFCRQTAAVKVSRQGLWNWEHGDFVQKAFPDLTPGQRETVMNGSHEECFDKAFPKEEKEESDELHRD